MFSVCGCTELNLQTLQAPWHCELRKSQWIKQLSGALKWIATQMAISEVFGLIFLPDPPPTPSPAGRTPWTHNELLWSWDTYILEVLGILQRPRTVNDDIWSSCYGIQEWDLSLWKEDLQQNICGEQDAEQSHPPWALWPTLSSHWWLGELGPMMGLHVQAASLSPEASAFQHFCRNIWIYTAGNPVF